jgi:transketolase
MPGAYVLTEVGHGAALELIMIASGSEVSLALAAAQVCFSAALFFNWFSLNDLLFSCG